MHNQIVLLHNLKQECLRHKKLIKHLEKRQKQLPEGSLLYKRNCYYRAVSYNGKREQITISERLTDYNLLIHELRESRYITKALPILKENLSCLNKSLSKFQIYDPDAIKAALPSQYKEFDFTELTLEGDVNPQAWAKENYEHNTSFLEHLKYKSEGGQQVRSKAEADIATALEQAGLAFRYEPILYLGKHKVSPDFCVLHPLDRQQIYWEHFGNMDNPQYAYDTMEKLRIYAEHGYQLGNNLIMTWETGQHPLTFQHIKDRIRTYLS